MKNQFIHSVMIIAVASLCLFSCQSKPTGSADNAGDSSGVHSGSQNNFGGFPNQVAWGKHLVAMGGCSDCHTPKKMTSKGQVPDRSMYLAGHPANVPLPKVNRKEIENKGLMTTNDLSFWIGPWGITYAANLTPDPTTGLGNWTAGQFLRCIREGKENGSPNARPLLPPMNFVAAEVNHAASDAELTAIFAYLKTINPVHNPVPAPQPPVSAGIH